MTEVWQSSSLCPHFSIHAPQPPKDAKPAAVDDMDILIFLILQYPNFSSYVAKFKIKLIPI